MPRKSLTIAAALACLASAAILNAPSALASVSQASAQDCSGTIQIDPITADPPSVTPGQMTTATAIINNCTDQPVQFALSFYVTWVGPSSGTPADCPQMGPNARLLNLPANGQAKQSASMLMPTSCAATSLQFTLWISGSQTVTQTIDVPVHRPSACSVSYANFAEWLGGFGAQVTINNLGATPIDGWDLGFTFPGAQQIGTYWNAGIGQSGQTIKAANMPYNAVIAPGKNVTFGFIGTRKGFDVPPSDFILNGARCVVPTPVPVPLTTPSP